MLTDLSLDPTDVPPGRLVEAAIVAEDAGFDGVWLYDHVSGAALGGSSSQDPWPLLGAIAVSTRRVTIGPLVANVTMRHPAHVAVASATLQDLSGGRFWLGVGAGAGPESPFASEMSMTGQEPRSAPVRRAMVADAIAAIRQLWSGGGELSNEHFPLSDAHGFPIPQPVPPIIVGANGPKMAELGGALADGVNLHSFEDDLPGLIATVRRAAAGGSTVITVEAPMEPEWLEGPSNGWLRDLGVDRLILAWHGAAVGIDAIEAAGRRIHHA
jgi:alkanesulfonate monooxygenase SsuD/methylene tetrahydromethanopterin reductase-like flavin-dependent oxidoreductase (luciferase family)